nr:galactokinase [Corynebacterium lactis]
MAQWATTRTKEEGAAAASSLFASSFGRDPEGVFAAPGRVNLIGEHVDYADGICLPFALSQSTFAALGAREDGNVRIVSDLGPAGEPFIIPLSDVGPNNPANWAGYGVGTIWAMMQAGLLPEQLGGFDIALTSDVPIGGGLSSSAALECSVGVGAFWLAHGRAPSEDEVAGIVAAAMRAENEVVGASTGGLDQRIVMKGKADHALAIDFADNTDRQVPASFAKVGLKVLVINTNVRHALVDGKYASRRGVIDQVTAGLGVKNLREIDDAVEQAKAWAAGHVAEGYEETEWVDVVARRVRHVVTEIDRTAEAIDRLSSGDFDQFGTLMIASHLSLRDDYEVSCPELDVAVDVALENGALGARMTGGGFGGSAIALLPEDRIADAATAIAARCRELGMPEPEFLMATPSEGATKL